jgi:DNA-binding SARP family transcriptional activator
VSLAVLVARAYRALLEEDTPGAARVLESALSLLQCPHDPLSSPLAVAGPSPHARVVVRTLGAFEVLVDGAPLAGGRKQPTRTLALLKALIALGGRAVARAALVDLLWPDVEGDLGQNALEAALHRLRARIGVPDAIATRRGYLELNPRLVWVDALAFCALPAGAADEDLLEQAFTLYRGAFLHDERDASWALRPRERMRARFVNLVSHAAQTLEAAGQLPSAARLYERALAVDDLAGVFHEGLERCLHRQGQAGEARMAHTRAARVLAQPA